MSNKESSNKELNIKTEVSDTYLDDKELQEEEEEEEEEEDRMKGDFPSIEEEDAIMDDSSLEETSNINLQLGDIIELYAPSNSDLHSHRFYIKFINSNKIKLLNDKKKLH